MTIQLWTLVPIFWTAFWLVILIANMATGRAKSAAYAAVFTLYAIGMALSLLSRWLP